MRIYVGNLSYTTTEDSLRTAFSQYGDVSEATVVTDRETGRSRGFGFVTMPNDDEAKAAMEALNGSSLDGRSLRVNEAQAKAEGGRGGHGGGGGGGGRRDRW